MPLTNLCNRLVVMSTPRMPSSRARGLAPFRPPQPAHPSRPRSRACVRAALSTAPLASHCWHPQPRVGTRLTPCPPAVASPTASRVARCREPRPISALSASIGPARPTTSAPCRACPARPRRDAPFRTRTHSAAVASTPTAFRARGTFRRQVPFRPPHALTQGAAFRAATSTPALPPGAQLPTRFHARGPRARPKIVPGCSPEFPSHVPLVDFCNWAIHEHTQ
jgi:hypothetical protein